MFAPFYVNHTDPKVKDGLGVGICIGILPFFNPDDPTVSFKCLVLWDGVRALSPSPHLNTDLEWLHLKEDDNTETTIDSIIAGIEDGDFTEEDILQAIQEMKDEQQDALDAEAQTES